MKIPNLQKNSGATDRLWLLLLAASLAMNVYFVLHKKNNKADEVLASGGNQTFRWRDVSGPAQRALRDLDKSYYHQLKREADRWAENLVLPQEAKARGVSVDELLKSEVHDKTVLAEGEAQKHYARSPSADSLPHAEALGLIEAELRSQRASTLKSEFLNGLFTKYGVKFILQPPASDDGKPAIDPVRFPVYEAPAAGPEVDAQTKRVVRAPSRGPDDAPLVIEVYSDFHCPFSKRFAGVLGELDQAYPGKVRTVFHHFPLPMHPGAEGTHEASVCAQEQGKFWEFHDSLMAMAEDPAGAANLAERLDLDKAVFQTCVDSKRYQSWVRQEAAQGQKAGVSSTPSFFMNGRFARGMMNLDALKPIVDWHLDPIGPYPGPQNAPPDNAPQAPARQQGGLDRLKVYTFPADWLTSGASMGPADAPITLIEFFDYDCPFCQKGAQITDQILAAYPGKVRVLAKHLPMPMHPNAQKASEALLCANEQNKFWEFRGGLFGEFWTKHTVEDLKALAKKTGLDAGSFDACLDGSRMKEAVDADLKIGRETGVAGTPTFFVNGTPIIGAVPIERFKQLIDEKLK